VKVIIKFQNETRPELNRWVAAFDARRAPGRAFARAILGEMMEILRRHSGPPPEALREIGVLPPTWWWRYAEDFWLRVVVRDQRPPLYRFWEGRVVRITIVEIRRRPP
jgi:hypothetical protein